MQTTLALATIAAIAYAAPQGGPVTEDISPEGAAPAGFSETYSGKFQIAAVNTTVSTTKRDLTKRAACPTAEGSLVITLVDGKLTDQAGRIGYIASNYQFQFDGPPQAGAIYTDGFSAGGNSSLALGSSAIFYQCLSGSFYNLYDRSWAPQCSPAVIQIIACGDSSPEVVTQAPDGQPAATTIGSAISQISDGQPQGPSAIPITQIGDGQPQAPTGVISQIGDGQAQAPTGVISQIGDGQPQAPTGVISQIGDGQPQAPTGVISQISDGQPQAPTGIISQISDGQPQAPTSTAAPIPISQIGDGQPQAPVSTATPTPVSQIGDGQLQAPLSTTLAPAASRISQGTVSNTSSTITPSSPLIAIGAGNTILGGSSFMAIIGSLFAALL